MWTSCNRRAAQRGDMLLEALAGVLITAIAGAGLAYVASRISVSQYDARIEGLAVEQMRAALQGKGVSLCNGTPDAFVLPNGRTVSPQAVCGDPPAVGLTIGQKAGQSASVQAPREVALCVPVSALGLDKEQGRAPFWVGTNMTPGSALLQGAATAGACP